MLGIVCAIREHLTQRMLPVPCPLHFYNFGGSQHVDESSQLSGKVSVEAKKVRDAILARLAPTEPAAEPSKEKGVQCPCGKICDTLRGLFNHRRQCAQAQASADITRLSEISAVYTIKANRERAEILKRLAPLEGALVASKEIPEATCPCGFVYTPGRRHPKMQEGCLAFKTSGAYIAYSKAMAQQCVIKHRAQKKA